MKFNKQARGSSSIIALLIGLLILITIAGFFYFKQEPSKTATISNTQPPRDAELQRGNSVDVAKKILQKSGDTQDCPADSNWFPHSQTQRPNDATFASSSNCEFHQWSWQNFLWLTQKVNGEPRFMSFASPESLLGLEREGLLPRMAKSNTPESFDEFLQAGTDGILIAHNGRAVYYSQYIDDTFVDFIKSNNLTDPDTVQSFIANDPATPFPVGAMELKASWMVVEEGDDVSNMFTTQTKIAKLVNKNGQIIVDTTQNEEVTVALVGFHIAGVVNGHPEMIWATFEHHNNAPNMPTNLPLDQAVSDQDSTFYTKNTIAGDCNINYTSSNKLVLDEATQAFSPITQVCRQYQYGNQDGVNQKNDKNIEDLNANVSNLFDSDDIWKNYSEVGAIWFKGLNALQPGMSIETDKLLAGSLSLSNSTIETFTQVASTQDNCFRCHNTLQAFPTKLSLDPLPESNLNISHAFQNIYFWSQEKAEAE